MSATRTSHRLLTVLAFAVSAVGVPTLASADDTAQVTRKQQAQQQRQRNAALEAAGRWAERNPERYAKLVPPGSNLAPGSVPIEIRLRNGQLRTVLADSLGQTVLSLGYAEIKANDQANLGRVYAQVHAMLPAKYRDGLADPAKVAGAPVGVQQRALRKLGSKLVANFDLIRLDISRTAAIPGLVVNPIGDCMLETGWEASGSEGETSARCAIGDYASLGLMRNLSWILKDDLTCVKDQGNRGTCVAHAIAANVETMIQVQGGGAENLSEQDLYFWAKIETDMSGRYVDGLNPDEVYDALDAQNFEIQYESRWNYNRSPDRIQVQVPPLGSYFLMSCDPVNYTGEMCTEFAFQSQETPLGGGTYLYTYPSRASQGWEILNWSSIPDLGFMGLPDFQIDTAIVALESEYPVHVSFVVGASFKSPDANGYVQYNPADPVPPGSHSVLAVGYVANADLPVGVPADPDGRGYFVIKNSWGIGAVSDCGFYYVSTEYLRNWAYAYRYLDKTISFN